MSTSTKHLGEAEFKKTFVDPMQRVAEGCDPPFDFWNYFDQIPEDHFGGHDCSEGHVQSAYNDATGSYQHVLINSENKNVFMVLVLDLKSNSVYGHRLLDLNKEYGLDDEDFE